MKHLAGIAALTSCLLINACGQQDVPEPSTGTWVGTITTEGNVTTVVNESGSVWGGTATLVEELSIGVENGAPEYMFGRIADVHADAWGIYVIDGQVPVVRVYDLEGDHVRDLGGRGQGPGEYQRPVLISTASDRRVFVADRTSRRINVYAPDGAALNDTYPQGIRIYCCTQPMVVDEAGVPWLAYQDADPDDPSLLSITIRAHGLDGLLPETRHVPEIEFEQVTVRGRDDKRFNVPFGPNFVWGLTPAGAVLAGANDRYRFERHAADGTVTIVEGIWNRFPVAAREADYYRRVWIRQRLAPAGWDGSEIPDSKPPFISLRGATTGEVWVVRLAGGVEVPGCDDLPSDMQRTFCWRDTFFFDVFGADGRFLGRVDIPEDLRDGIMSANVAPHLDGETLLGATLDAAGTLRVKRYRLVLPGEGEPQ